MGICETVKSLAESIAFEKQIESPRHRLQIDILRLMPLYRDIRDLGAWDSAFLRVVEEKDDNSEIGKLLWEVFEFGRLNLYSAFKAELTSKEFDRLSKLFDQCKVKVPTPLTYSDW